MIIFVASVTSFCGNNTIANQFKKKKELFIRLNTVTENDHWSHMGRLIMLQQVGTITGKRNIVNSDHGSRFQRAAAHAAMGDATV
jgi:hypothetical protein